MTLRALPSPTDDAFAAKPADTPALVNRESWTRAGVWRFRQFGNEIQLRSDALPHCGLDLWRSEAEGLYLALAEMLGAPAPLPYRVPAWERLKQWWDRRVWNRKNHATLDRARRELIEEFSRRSPWG